MPILILLLVGLIALRCIFQLGLKKTSEKPTYTTGVASFIGDVEVQADAYAFIESKAGLLALLADGFGKGNLGKVASHVAVKSCRTLYQQYKNLTNPQYFFQRAFNLANFEVLKLLEERGGGTSLMAAFIHRGQLVYALAGDIKAFVFRNGEMIPLSEGHTLNKLAAKAYTEGKLTKQEALWTLQEERLWNYIGQDGFKEIELYDIPVQLKPNDIIVLLTKGVYENTTICEMEAILAQNDHEVDHKAQVMIQLVKNASTPNKENATVMLIQANDTRKDTL